MRRKLFLSVAVVALVVVVLAGGVLTGLSLAQPGGSPVPSLINYQGSLLDSLGDPVADGPYGITFSIYDVETAGTALWQETQTVDVEGSLFSVMLGSVTDFPDDLFDGNPRYIGVQVGAGDEMTPRQLLASVPYAFHAEEAEHAKAADSVQQLIQEFVVASGESVTAGDVVSFLDGYVQKGFVPGDDILYGSGYVFNTALTSYISAAALSADKFVVAYRDNGNSNYGTAVIGDVSGTTITYGSGYVFNSATTAYNSAAALSSDKFVVAYRNDGNSYHGTAKIGDVPPTSNMIGIANESKTAGETVPVVIGGVSDGHSGLTPGAVYYRDTAGGLTTTANYYRIGMAISATDILLGLNKDTWQ